LFDGIAGLVRSAVQGKPRIVKITGVGRLDDVKALPLIRAEVIKLQTLHSLAGIASSAATDNYGLRTSAYVSVVPAELGVDFTGVLVIEGKVDGRQAAPRHYFVTGDAAGDVYLSEEEAARLEGLVGHLASIRTHGELPGNPHSFFQSHY